MDFQPDMDGAVATADAMVQPPTQTSPGSTLLPDAAGPGMNDGSDAGSAIEPLDAATPTTMPPTTMPPTTTPPTTAPATMPPPTTAAVSCSRDTLRQSADAYLQALSMGDPTALNARAEVRYTENGKTQTLGLGLWVNRPQTMFSWHVLDEVQCSTATVAVVSQGVQRIVLGLRLRYVADQLLEAEAQVVTPNGSYYDPDSLVAMDDSPWQDPVPAAARMSRDALEKLAERYFDSVTDPSMLPAHAPGCQRRQNGELFEGGGGCGKPGDQRFEQRRYPVIDETLGVVTTILVYQNYVGMYLIKAQDNTIQEIDIIGGATASSSGW